MAVEPLLILGTRNRHKVFELGELLAPYGIDLKCLADFPAALEVVEDGETFRANAIKKAVEQARHLQQWVLAEDSGLAVDALQGRPGVYSARYAGPACDDEANNDLLLRELADAPPARRTAHYVCHAALSDPTGVVRAEAVGRCQGRIRSARHGQGGFGYDPLFEIVEYHLTFGQLSPTVKAAISHRARAMRQIMPPLAAMLRSQGTTKS